jgi:hypothetical protein
MRLPGAYLLISTSVTFFCSLNAKMVAAGRSGALMPDHRIHAGVNETLRNQCRDTWIPGIVLGVEPERGRHACNHRMRRIDLVDSEPDAMFDVFAQMRLGPRQCTRIADYHDIVTGPVGLSL